MIRYKSIEDLVAATNKLDGQLTASLHVTEADYDAAGPLIPALERKVGRIIINGWPTGVEVGHAIVHGGPYPATSDSKTTSVGTLAIERFLRPVAYQNFPDQLRPAPLQDANPGTLTASSTANQNTTRASFNFRPRARLPQRVSRGRRTNHRGATVAQLAHTPT